MPQSEEGLALPLLLFLLWIFLVYSAGGIDNTFSGYIDVSSWEEGTYFFVLSNPGDARVYQRFYVISTPAPTSKEEAREKWEWMGFKNQGQAIRYLETGKDSRIGE